jgi:hypothetical protein
MAGTRVFDPDFLAKETKQPHSAISLSKAPKMKNQRIK